VPVQAPLETVTARPTAAEPLAAGAAVDRGAEHREGEQRLAASTCRPGSALRRRVVAARGCRCSQRVRLVPARRLQLRRPVIVKKAFPSQLTDVSPSSPAADGWARRNASASIPFAERWETRAGPFVNVRLSHLSKAARESVVDTADALPTRVTSSTRSTPATVSRAAGWRTMGLNKDPPVRWRSLGGIDRCARPIRPHPRDHPIRRSGRDLHDECSSGEPVGFPAAPGRLRPACR
jgi:hypothetical protein